VFRNRDLVAELRVALKMSLGGTISWWIASELGARRPLFAALVPLVAISGDPFAAVYVSFARILGVFTGVGIGLAVLQIDASTTTRVAIALLAGTIGGIALKVGDRPNIEVAISALFMLAFATADPSQLGVQRIWETGIGAGVSIVISSFVWPPDPVRELTRRLQRLRQQVAADLAAIADDLATGSGATGTQMDALRENSLAAVRDVFELEPAKRALRWSPLRRRDAGRLAELTDEINLAARAARHARSLGRDVADEPILAPTLAAATRHLADATDRRLAGADAAVPLERAAAELAQPFDGRTAIVAAQLRQFLDDLRSPKEG
jgi:uncharacterized membrane protein YgaE (UPF0421/DUF939 family)